MRKDSVLNAKEGVVVDANKMELRADLQLKILHLEDNAKDAALIQSIIEADNLSAEIVLVDNREDFVSALKERYDLILADLTLPAFDGLNALALARKMTPETPFIFVSGTLGEDQAVETVKSGATDYVLKDQLSRLVPSIHRALREVEEHKARKRLEEQLFQSQKLDALGRLAGGIAHDFNNQLTVINGFVDIALGRLPDDHPVRKDLQEIKNAGERSSNLTRQLLSFTRRPTEEKKLIDLNELIVNMDKMLKRLVGEMILVSTIPDPAGGFVYVDPSQIEHVLVNLVVNARDAMPSGGKLIIETSEVVLDHDYVAAHPSVKPGKYVMLAVSDTGTGMSDEVKRHLFEPFFTTKAKDKGTGLGLATSHAVIKQNGGHIGVYSENGKGTTFKIYLPLAKSKELEKTQKESCLQTGVENILLVEDEEPVRKIISDMLSSCGYHVQVAKDGKDALALAKEKNHQIKLLLTDVVMPEVTGAELAGQVRKYCPEIKVLFMSGYTDTFVKQDMIGPESHFIQKPLSLLKLTTKVRQVLDAA